MARRQNPSAKIIALGCYAERAPDAVAEIEGIDLVIGNEDKASLIQLMKGAAISNQPLPGWVQTSTTALAPLSRFRTAAIMVAHIVLCR